MIVTAQARRDLKIIQHYIARTGGIEVGRKFVLSVSTHLERIALTGQSGVPRDAVRPGLRLVVHDRYNIYFRVTQDDTVIVRVLHSARDVMRLHFDEDEPSGN